MFILKAFVYVNLFEYILCILNVTSLVQESICFLLQYKQIFLYVKFVPLVLYVGEFKIKLNITKI